MQVAIIPADNTQPIRFEDITSSLEALQGAVGGDVQVVGLREYSMNMYLNENGKLEGLPTNLRATVLCTWAESLRSDDYINGDAVVLGPVDEEEGVDTGLTEVQLDWLRGFDAEMSGLCKVGD